jgi:hypothetical protein
MHRFLLGCLRSLRSTGHQPPPLRLEDVVWSLGWRSLNVDVRLAEVLQRAHASSVFSSGSAATGAHRRHLSVFRLRSPHVARLRGCKHLGEVVTNGHDSRAAGAFERQSTPRDVGCLEFLKILDTFRAGGAPESLRGEHRVFVVLIHGHDQVVKCFELFLQEFVLSVILVLVGELLGEGIHVLVQLLDCLAESVKRTDVCLLLEFCCQLVTVQFALKDGRHFNKLFLQPFNSRFEVLVKERLQGVAVIILERLDADVVVRQTFLAEGDLPEQVLELIAVEDSVVVDIEFQALKLGEAQLVVLELLLDVRFKLLLVLFHFFELFHNEVPLILLVFLEEIEISDDLLEVRNTLKPGVDSRQLLENDLE